MTGKERIKKILKHQKTDRIGYYEHFWSDTYKAWKDKVGDEPFPKHFGMDMHLCWGFDLTIDLDYEPETIEETEETILKKDGNGAFLRRHKKRDTTPEHVDFTIKSYEDWLEVKDKLKVEDRRINFEGYREAKKFAKKNDMFFCLSGVNVFECMHPVCGHEHMLMGSILEPEWIKDMVKTYSELIVNLQKRLFEKEGLPDGIWYYEDMGFKNKPFMSPDMHKELIFPAHKRTIDYAKSLDLPVIMHSCGYVRPLIPYMIEAGIDCLQVIEVKAGMDLIEIYETFGDQIALMGGIDVRCTYNNSKEEIDKELESKIPIVKQKHGFIFHSDHSIPNNVKYETYKYFVDKALKLGSFDK